MAKVQPRVTRRHVLLEPVFAVVAMFVGQIVAFWIQWWGTDHLGWFDEPCNDMGRGLALCLAPSATRGWQLVAFFAGTIGGLALWLAIRVTIERRRARKAAV